jgi:hypothetical protein
MMDLAVTGDRSIAKNMNCTFVKEILKEIYPDLKHVNEGMSQASWMSLGTILILLFLSLGSFFAGQCFHRIHKFEKKKVDGKLKNATNKIVRLAKSNLHRSRCC